MKVTLEAEEMAGHPVWELVRKFGAKFARETGAAPSTITLAAADWDVCWIVASAQPTTWFVTPPKDGRVGLSTGMFGREVQLFCDVSLQPVRESRFLDIE